MAGSEKLFVMKVRVLFRFSSRYFTSLRGSGKSFRGALYACELNRLVADKSCGAIHLAGVGATVLGVLFGSQNEETQGLMETMQTSEVKVGSIHNIEGSRFGDNPVQNINIVQFTVRNVNENRDIATQVEKGMEFYR